MAMVAVDGGGDVIADLMVVVMMMMMMLMLTLVVFVYFIFVENNRIPKNKTKN